VVQSGTPGFGDRGILDVLEIVHRPSEIKGVMVLDRRWMVERMHIGLAWCRCRAKDREWTRARSLAGVQHSACRVRARRRALVQGSEVKEQVRINDL